MIRQAREELGWTEEKLSQESGLSLDQIARLENGTPDNTPHHIYQRVCVPLGIKLPELCTVRAAADPQRFGKGIRTLRHRLEQSRAQLAASTSISESTLACLERGAIDQDVGTILERLALGLRIALPDISFVVFDSPNTRRFHSYNVGIGKSGTMSMARIFSRYASWHEFLAEKTMRRVYARIAGESDDEELESFLTERDRLGNLEFDSAGFHANYIESLICLFPDARFVVTIRDCYSWLDSFLDTMLNYAPSLPGWRFDGTYKHNFGLTPEMISSRERLAAELPGIIDRLLGAWAHPNRRVLSAVPESRRLIVRTSDIRKSLPRLASFVGVEEETLNAEESRANVRPARQRNHLLEAVDGQIVEESVSRTCADLMRSYFPEHSLSRYLNA